MLKLRKPVLRKAGLSGAKILAIKDLAPENHRTASSPPSIKPKKLSDEELRQTLVSVRGIGAWTVEMFLDLPPWPPRRSPYPRPRRQKKAGPSPTGKKHMPKPKELLAFGERWRPYRTIASWYMWRACQRAGNAAMRKIRPARVRKPHQRPKPKRLARSRTRRR